MNFDTWSHTDNDGITMYYACLPNSLDDNGFLKMDTIIGQGEYPLEAVSMLIDLLIQVKGEKFIFEYGTDE